jgi:tetratricopeptide (TPR) repeat protein
MDYNTKKKTYAGRQLIKGLELVLVFALVLFGLDVLDRAFKTPEADMISTQSIVVEEETAYEPMIEEAIVLEVDETMSAYDYFSVALSYQMDGQHQNAIDNYSRSIMVDAGFASSYLNRGVAYEYQGKVDVARADFWNWMTKNTREIHSARLTPGEATTISMAEGRMFIMPFYGEAGQRMSIQASSVILDQADPLIVVFNTSDQPIAGSDDIISSNGELLSMNSAISGQVLPETGTYALVVSHAGGGSYGDITVSLTLSD